MSTLSTLISAKLSPYAPASLAPSMVSDTYGLFTIPHCVSMMNNATNCFTVGEASTYSTTFCYCRPSGDCCLFTVPAGITEVQFQIWGAGGASNTCQWGGCCGFSPPGGSGEYTYVRMRVTAGQQYTLCAGGACASGTCCVGSGAPGCNSFVCGSNSTCIVSCGGHSGIPCILQEVYPENYTTSANWGSNAGAASYIQPQNAQACTFYPFRHPTARIFACLCAAAPDILTTTNTINMVAKVPSILGGVQQCGVGICHFNYFAPAIHCDHTIRYACTGYIGYNTPTSTNCMDNNPNFNYAGAGGPAPIFACFCGCQTCGYRGRSGSILVKMR